jgi:hypothetical protein
MLDITVDDVLETVDRALVAAAAGGDSWKQPERDR